MHKNITMLALLLLCGTPVQAQNWYVDGGLGFVNFDDGVDEVSPTNVYIRGGYQINRYFNLGLEATVTVSPDQIAAAPDVDFGVNAVTLYARGGIPVGESIFLYAQIGRTNTELQAEYLGVEFTTDDNDTSYGFGADIDIGSRTTYLALNYSMYNNNDGVDVTAFNLGLGVRF